MVDGVLVGEAVERAVVLPDLGVDTDVPGGQEVRPVSTLLSCLPALREQLGRKTIVETVEAGQGVGARDSLISTTTPVLRLCEVIKARAGAGKLLHLGGPQVNLRQEEEEEERGERQ